MSSLSSSTSLSLFALAPLFAAGCGLAVTPPLDAAAVDAAVPLGDAAALVDAAPPGTDAPACADPIVWIDDAPITRAVLGDRPPVLVAGPAGLDLLYAYWDADACFSNANAVCVGAEHFALVGGEAAHRTEPRWFYALGEPRRLFGGRDPGGAPHFAIASADHVAWSHAPAGDTWDTAEGSVEVARVLGDVAFGTSEVYVHTATSAPRPGSRDDTLVSGVLTAYALDGSNAHPVDRDLTFGSDFWSPRLLAAVEGPWLAIVSDLDFPPTVQIAGPGTIRSFDGSSCGVESYDVAPYTAADVALVEDCGARTHVVVRPGLPEPSLRSRFFEDRDAAAGVASRIAYGAGHFVSARRATDGAVHVAVQDDRLDVIADVVVPGSRGTLPGPVAVAAADDGTMAVLYVEPYAAGAANGEARLFRFRLCGSR